jgi:hypothetical protein
MDKTFVQKDETEISLQFSCRVNGFTKKSRINSIVIASLGSYLRILVSIDHACIGVTD